MHVCPGCNNPDVPSHRLACRACWYRLPQTLRSEIWRTYNKPYLISEYIAARAAALGWYRNN